MVLDTHSPSVIQLQVHSLVWLNGQLSILVPVFLLAYLSTSALIFDEWRLANIDVILTYLISLRANIGHPFLLLNGSILLSTLILFASMISSPLK